MTAPTGPTEFFAGCTSREEELALLQRASGQSSAPPRVPDPIADPEGFQDYLAESHRRQESLVTEGIESVRAEQSDTARRNQLWTEFSTKYPDLSKSTQVVQAAFIEETGDGTLPNDQLEALELMDKIATRIRSYGVGDAPGEPEAEPVVADAFGNPIEAEPLVAATPATAEPANPDRTTGITAGSHSTPSNAPASTKEGETVDLIAALRNVRSEGEMAGYF